MDVSNVMNDDMPVVADISAFDKRSGNRLERLIFNNRAWVLLVCLLLTAFFAVQLRGLELSASFEKMLPQSHPYIQNYLANRGELRGLGDSVRIVVENPKGDVFDKAFLERFGKLNDEVFLLPGVDRAWMRSIWSPVVRWTEVTEEGFSGGPVLPERFDGSPAAMDALRLNIARAGIVGSLVAEDYRSIAIVVPLLPQTEGDKAKAGYKDFWEGVKKLRSKYEIAEAGQPEMTVRVTGFAALAGTLIDGLGQVMWFFVAATIVATVIIFLFTRCLRSTALVLGCSLIAVVWQLGLIVLLGYGLDPFSMLVPFLVFAIGVSHGAQKMNGVMQDVGRGTHRLVAARYTFRRLFLAGLTALVADAVGFAVLMIIDIPVIRELAMGASLGVAVLVFTNLILLPVLLSYTGVSLKAARRSLKEDAEEGAGHGLMGHVWAFLDKFTERGWASVAVLAAVALGVAGFVISKDVQVGDLDAGAPELRADSRYNKDLAYITSHYGVSSDVFAVIVKTPQDQCGTYETLTEVDRLATALSAVPGVQRTASLADTIRSYMAGSYEGNPKWLTLGADQRVIDTQITAAAGWNSEFLNTSCSVTPVLAFLSDHKAETLNRVVAAANAFAAEHGTPDRQFLLAAGNSGVDAATNIVVREANTMMLLYVYAAVVVLCAITFRNWRAVVIAVLPLVLTSILAEALMVKLGIGIKVATLPVVALGVGIGVDYALYLLSVQLARQRAGYSLADAYRQAVAFTGKVVGLVGVTLAAGVVTWAWSPIKFQADMGIMLTFMFVFNMIGALVLIPALSHFLLPRVGQATQRQEKPSAFVMKAQEKEYV
ncbi:RND family transporter [Diaphorobacter sp. HDW4B]|uniref:efflux RND transporter permease subunit n=1 Tax=Diaphorobacter sp. HDW4B TaxID=2714925 RepID=UPI001F0FE038|nr:MMPL family transporter [Diaphorobacter sp. HDW4B]